MVSSTLLNNMMNPTRANAGESYRKGADHALAKRIKEADKIQQAERHRSDLISAGLNQESKRFSNSQAPIIAKERTATHNSNLETAGVGRDSSRTSTKKTIQDMAHDKSEREIKDTFNSINIASSLPYEEQTIFIDNLIEDYDGHGRLGTVFKYMKLAEPEARNKIFQDLNKAGMQGGYLEELYSQRQSSKRPTNMGSYLANVRQEYMNKNNGQEPPAGFMKMAQERFQKISGSQAYERKYGTVTGDIDANLTTSANKLRQVEAAQEGAKKDATMKAEIENTSDLLAAKGIITPMAMKATGKEMVAKEATKMIDYYMELDKIGGIINTKKSAAHNATARALSTKAGQKAAGAVGTEAQSIRNKIAAMKPLILQGVRQATGMSARGMDSDKELEFYLAAVSDEKKDLQSNIAALVMIDEIYGTGELGAKMSKSIPEDELESINDKIQRLEKEKGMYVKKRLKWVEEKRKALKPEAIERYYTSKPANMSQDEWDRYFIEGFEVLPEEK